MSRRETERMRKFEREGMRGESIIGEHATYWHVDICRDAKLKGWDGTAIM
jgi:hypothetical protein